MDPKRKIHYRDVEEAIAADSQIIADPESRTQFENCFLDFDISAHLRKSAVNCSLFSLCRHVSVVGLLVPGPSAKFPHHQLKKIFIVRRARLRWDIQPRADHVRNALAVEASNFRWNFQSARQKSFNQLGFLHSQARSLMQGEVSAGRSVEEEAGFAVRGLMDHQRSSNVVAQAPVFCVQQHSEDTHSIKSGKKI